MVTEQRSPISAATAGALLTLFLLGLPPAESLAATAETAVLEVVSVDPARAHRVGHGETTTFVLTLTNTAAEPASARLTVRDGLQGWRVVLSEGDFWFQPKSAGVTPLDLDGIDPGGKRLVVVSVTPDGELPTGQTCLVTIDAALSGGGIGSVTVGAVVHDQPKVYLLTLDGLSPQYVMLGRRGEPDPPPGGLLTPNLRSFLDEAAWFPRGRTSLPSGTDMSMFMLYTGSWPGTSGIPYVGFFFKGWDDEGKIVSSVITSEELRFGAEGRSVLSIFDVAKDPAHGGDPDTFTAFISGKFQLDHLFRDSTLATHLDILADGQVRPEYLTAPQPYVLGDPITDEDALTDRDGINLSPSGELRMHPYGYGLTGEDPLFHPSDRWIATGALRIIAAEDPDIFAVHLSDVDEIHHGAGAADRPQEWINTGAPDTLWDDLNIFSWNANREPVLDVVHEADACLGQVIKALGRRGVMESSIVFVGSDHGGITYTNHQLDTMALLDAAGLGEKVRRVGSYAEIGSLFLWDESEAELIEGALESYTVTHPLWQREVRPYAVITREEMDSGVDSVLGRFGRDGGPRRGELYSEWLIDYPVEDNSKVVWPDLIVYTTYRLQMKNTTTLPVMIGGHSGTLTQPVLFALKGPPFAHGLFDEQDTALSDVMPTLYDAIGWTPPANVDGRVMTEILLDREPGR